MDFEGASILIADDDRVVRRIVVAKLYGLGYDVEEAEDGQEALEILEEGEVPDVLITDSNMPRMNGLQLVRKLRESEDRALSLLPIIMLTARQSEQDIIQGLETGLDDYVIKPFSPDELAARVRTVLWRYGRRGAAEER
ncbi:MAG: response regulator transcription factor [Actinomycetota bacterium]|nr:response regulator transcription factor [Actinomycetota bacterium]